ncbi:MAG: polyamine aminopropyltransferase [Dehalococcoidales bacterium]|nr:polyamine aminopropyltransferase [Dehalococcoidales bacterium]
MDTDPDKWLKDKINENFIQLHGIDEVMYEGRTKYQAVQIVRSRNLGVCLVLDNKIQSSEGDEFIYHEAMVQPAMITHPKPEKVFIAGGGEGATLREVLRHKTVKKAVMADVDDQVTALCKKYLPGHGSGAFEDRRASVHHADARKYLEQSGEKFDIMILDLPDPIEEGPASLLFTQEFYRTVYDKLTDDGLISVQAGSASLTELLNLTAVYNTLKSVFPIVVAYATHMPCFGGPWGFCIASKQYNPALLAPEEVDGLTKERGLEGLKFYDGETHRGMFALPKYVREAMARQARIITDKNPLYLYKT